MVGNGTGDSSSDRNNAFSVSSDGTCYAQGAFTGSGADFAEWFESLDGNKIPVGNSVTLVGSKIKIAEKGDIPIEVISNNAGFVGNSTHDEWKGKYLKNFDREFIWEEVDVEK